MFHTWSHLCPRCQEFLCLCICPSLGQEQEPGGSDAAQGSLLSAKGTTQSSAAAQLPWHQDSVLTCRNQSPAAWLCAESTGLGVSSMHCARSPSCAPYCPGAVAAGAQSPVPSSGGSGPARTHCPALFSPFCTHHSSVHLAEKEAFHAAVQVGCGPAGERSS